MLTLSQLTTGAAAGSDHPWLAVTWSDLQRWFWWALCSVWQSPHAGKARRPHHWCLQW